MKQIVPCPALVPTPAFPRVILGENETLLRRRLAQGLRSAGYEVVEATSGTDVLACVEFDVSEDGWSTTDDVIIADVQMPGASGIDILRQVHAYDFRARVILISRSPDRSLEEEARRLGASAVLNTPVSSRDLMSALAT